MEAELKRLLAIEEEAEHLVADAESDRHDQIAAARNEARELELAFQRDAELILARHVEKAEARANQAVAELQRHYEERDAQLRAAAKAHHDAALAEAVRLFHAATGD